jgi:hypothetical protein
LFSEESDFLTFTKAGYCNEIEIKVSRGDYFNDFKKGKHNIYRNSKQKYIHVKSEEIITRHTEWDGQRWIKYDLCESEWLEVEKILMPNRFYFAVPEGLIQPHEVPLYAGLMYFKDYGTGEIIREAPFLHKKKILPDVQSRLLKKFWYLSEA